MSSPYGSFQFCEIHGNELSECLFFPWCYRLLLVKTFFRHAGGQPFPELNRQGLQRLLTQAHTHLIFASLSSKPVKLSFLSLLSLKSTGRQTASQNMLTSAKYYQ